ncbi:MAG: hypothetical protein IT577_16370 [Verrucomicrobiae bacterium]|nr:hypothetical protein [Verrucomicrobiae bacterium]
MTARSIYTAPSGSRRPSPTAAGDRIPRERYAHRWQTKLRIFIAILCAANLSPSPAQEVRLEYVERSCQYYFDYWYWDGQFEGHCWFPPWDGFQEHLWDDLPKSSLNDWLNWLLPFPENPRGIATSASLGAFAQLESGFFSSWSYDIYPEDFSLHEGRSHFRIWAATERPARAPITVKLIRCDRSLDGMIEYYTKIIEEKMELVTLTIPIGATRSAPYDIIGDPVCTHLTPSPWGGAWEMVYVSLIPVPPIELAVDADRDGEILFGPDGDTTTEQQPCVFWVNSDFDRDNVEQGSGTPDWQDGLIQCARDLEDFTRIQISIGGLREMFADGEILLGFEWTPVAGNPAIQFYPQRDESGEDGYLKNPQDAADQIDPAYRQALQSPSGGTVIAPGPAVALPDATSPDCFPEFETTGLIPLLFEACGEGKGLLTLTLHDQDGNKIGDGPGVWLDLKHVRKMYQRAEATPTDGFPPPYDSSGEPQIPTVGFQIVNSGGHPFVPPPDEESRALIFVHGWDMTLDDYHSFSDTMFKRLWHQGYKGRFCAFRWPTISGGLMDHYNTSEHRAWKYGPALAAYVATQPGYYAKNIAAHSMGNIVAGAALLSGMQINNYALMQAAAPAGCYDASEAVNTYQRFLTAEASSPTPDWADDRGYRARLGGVAGNLINFYNADDYALVSGPVNWELNQIACKPNVIERTLFGAPKRWYGWYPQGFPDPALANRGWYNDIDPVTERWVHDHHESMSFIARPHSQAVGARAIQGCAVDSSINVGPGSIHGFGRDKSDHSAQFKRSIQQVDDFYTQLFDIVK